VFIYYYYYEVKRQRTPTSRYTVLILSISGHRVILKPVLRFSRSQRTSRYTKTCMCDSLDPSGHRVLACMRFSIADIVTRIPYLDSRDRRTSRYTKTCMCDSRSRTSRFICLFVHYITLLLLLLRLRTALLPHYTTIYHADGGTAAAVKLIQSQPHVHTHRLPNRKPTAYLWHIVSYRITYNYRIQLNTTVL
jgi:hypothetical protein